MVSIQSPKISRINLEVLDFVKSDFSSCNSKKKKKIFPEFPGFEPGNSDPIANHITTRP